MKMKAKNCLFRVVFISTLFFPFVLSSTNREDVTALNVMYESMNKPSQLDGWKSSGGDPCGESWKGIKCSGSAITEVDLNGLGLSGSMGHQLGNMKEATYFDVSKNNLKGEIPFYLPKKLEYIDLSGNEFTGSLPWSIAQMSQLKTLLVYQNNLKGQIGEMFSQLSKLKELDLSYNQLSGGLPYNMKDLSSLKKLHLHNNKLSGSIDVLASLPIDDLNIENNKFTGWIPDELKGIKKLKTNGNSWSSGPAPPPPPGQKSRRPSGKGIGVHHVVVIAAIVLGILLIIGLVLACLARKRRSSSSHFYEDNRLSHSNSFIPLHAEALNKDEHTELNSSFKEQMDFESRDSFSKKTLTAVHSIKHKEQMDFDLSASFSNKSLTAVHSIKHKASYADHAGSFSDNELTDHANTMSNPTQVSAYSLSELQTLTANFATSRLLGEGSIGRVYKAMYSDGRVLVVKKIDSSFFQNDKGAVLSDIVSNISKIRHPNIAPLLGYSSEQGQNMLVYDFYQNGSLHGFLHMSDNFSKPLTWNTRVKIALGTARAVEYMHEYCSPSCVHKDITSSNIFLDMDLNPRLSDCGLARFHPRTSQNLGIGYNAPECIEPKAYTAKSDVYSFGVVMLELLTGRKPYDSTRAKYEQILVRWASEQLNDIDDLEKMVDPALCGLYPPKSVTRFADVVASCVQSEPQFRPPMSEVVQSLLRVVQGSTRDDLSLSRLNSFDY